MQTIKKYLCLSDTHRLVHTHHRMTNSPVPCISFTRTINGIHRNEAVRLQSFQNCHLVQPSQAKVCVCVQVDVNVCSCSRQGGERGWLRCISCVAVYCFLEQEKWAYVRVM